MFLCHTQSSRGRVAKLSAFSYPNTFCHLNRMFFVTNILISHSFPSPFDWTVCCCRNTQTYQSPTATTSAFSRGQNLWWHSQYDGCLGCCSDDMVAESHMWNISAPPMNKHKPAWSMITSGFTILQVNYMKYHYFSSNEISCSLL